MRYKVWRSHSDPDKNLMVLTLWDDARGPAPEGNWTALVPRQVRGLGPWVGGLEGRLSRLRPLYRQMIRQHGFVVLNCRPSKLDLERPPRRRIRLRPGRLRPISAR